jgi:hypothetical protein
MIAYIKMVCITRSLQITCMFMKISEFIKKLAWQYLEIKLAVEGLKSVICFHFMNSVSG